jgi:hypothetical protein
MPFNVLPEWKARTRQTQRHPHHTRQRADREDESGRHHDVSYNRSGDPVPSEPPNRELQGNAGYNPGDRDVRAYGKEDHQRRRRHVRRTPVGGHGNAEQVDCEIEERDHLERGDTREQPSPEGSFERFIVHRHAVRGLSLM